MLLHCRIFVIAITLCSIALIHDLGVYSFYIQLISMANSQIYLFKVLHTLTCCLTFNSSTYMYGVYIYVYMHVYLQKHLYILIHYTGYVHMLRHGTITRSCVCLYILSAIAGVCWIIFNQIVVK